jgi:hypothetical protein
MRYRFYEPLDLLLSTTAGTWFVAIGSLCLTVAACWIWRV